MFKQIGPRFSDLAVLFLHESSSWLAVFLCPVSKRMSLTVCQIKQTFSVNSFSLSIKLRTLNRRETI